MGSSLEIPPSSSTVKVEIVDSTMEIKGLLASHFMGPDIKGFETLRAAAFVFLVTHTDSAGKERKLVFDLGAPKDWRNDVAPFMVEGFKQVCDDIVIEKNVSEILEDHGVSLESIESVIWSHPHFDHIGRPSLFPPTTNLLVGPGVKTEYFPGYPQVPSSPILEREFAGREVTQLELDEFNIEMGGFKAMDFFGDGSFYLVSAPGHAIGHMVGLARTTPDTFMLFGADSFHHASELRPNRHTPLPKTLTLSSFASPCPGELFHKIHPCAHPADVPERYHEALGIPGSSPDTTPFMTVSTKPDGASLAVDVAAARQTLSLLQVFDAHPDIFIAAAHDQALIGVVDLIPKVANDWKAQGWKEKSRWGFLNEFAAAIEAAT